MAKPKTPQSVVFKTAKPTHTQKQLSKTQTDSATAQAMKRLAAQRASVITHAELPAWAVDPGKPTVIPSNKQGVTTLPLPMPFNPKVSGKVFTGKVKATPLQKTLGRTVATAKPSPVKAVPAGIIRGGNTPTSTNTGPPSGQGSSSSTVPSGLAQLLAMAKVGTMLNPQDYANSVAGGQFDPTIAALQQQQTNTPLQGAQDQADISNWYGQVQAALTKAASAEQAQNGSAVSSLGDIGKGIMAGLGGTANPGNAMTGAVAANAVGTEQALGNVNQDFMNNMGGLLDLQKAGAASADTARMHQLSQNIALQIAQAQGSKAAAQEQALVQAQQQNAATTQQRFQNLMGIQGSEQQAQVAGVQNFWQQLMDQSTIDRNKATGTAALIRAKTGQYKATHSGPAKGSWAAMKPGDRALLSQGVLAAMQQAGGAKNVHGTLQALNDHLAQSGLNPSDPSMANWRNSLWSSIGVNPATVYGG